MWIQKIKYVIVFILLIVLIVFNLSGCNRLKINPLILNVNAEQTRGMTAKERYDTTGAIGEYHYYTINNLKNIYIQEKTENSEYYIYYTDGKISISQYVTYMTPETDKTFYYILINGTKDDALNFVFKNEITMGNFTEVVSGGRLPLNKPNGTANNFIMETDGFTGGGANAGTTSKTKNIEEYYNDYKEVEQQETNETTNQTTDERLNEIQTILTYICGILLFFVICFLFKVIYKFLDIFF